MSVLSSKAPSRFHLDVLFSLFHIFCFLCGKEFWHGRLGEASSTLFLVQESA